jgi:UDP-N-acetyl-2-amino-2-deoxyglucuronate dehydrogenase
LSYEQILTGNGFGLDDVRPSIETVYEIGNAKEAPLKGEYHPFLNGVSR